QQVAVPAEPDPRLPPGVNGGHFLALADVPQDDAGVRAATGEEATVGVPGHSRHGPRNVEPGQQPAALEIEQLHDTFSTRGGGHEPSVRRRVEPHRRVVLEADLAEDLAARQFVDAGDAVASGEEIAAAAVDPPLRRVVEALAADQDLLAPPVPEGDGPGAGAL